MSDISELAEFLYGDKRAEERRGDSTTTRTMTASAVSDSADGSVMVIMSDVVIPTEDPEGRSALGDVAVELPTTVDVREGDEVIVSTYGSGPQTSPVVTGVAGGGDRTATDVADAADKAEAAGADAGAARDAVDALADVVGDNSSAIGTNADAIANVAQSIEDERAERESYIRFGTTEDGRPAMEMGAADATAKMRLTNERLSFLDGDEVVAYVSGTALNISTAQIGSSLLLGKYAVVPRQNGHLSFKWVG